jgi:lysophospholipase L1-like esterase
MTKTDEPSIAFLGSSSVAGKGQAFDWIGELERRPQNRHVHFRRFGVGGDLAHNALRRLPQVVACRPNMVIIWVGGNDVLASVSNKVRLFSRILKRLPSEPSPEWFGENLRAIVRGLKDGAIASVAVCSLSPIGEDPGSGNPFQRSLNQHIKEYSAIINEIAREEAVSYIPIYEAMLAQIEASPGRALTSFQFLPFYRDAFRVLVLRKSPDEVTRINGWRFHTDGVHLNSRGGMIVAQLIQEFIDM